MIKDIKYSGISTAPSDYESPDGALTTSINLISEDQHLTPLFQPKVMMQLEADCKVIGIHRTSEYKHHIIYNETTSKVYWNNGLSTTMSEIGQYKQLQTVEFVGNTLLILTENAINYFLWKVDKYINLGDHLPNVEISFGLKGYPRYYSVSDESHSTFHITFWGIPGGPADFYKPFSEDNKKMITDQVMARVNKFLHDQTISKGKFALPFLLRYALRMYDGSLVCHSTPVLMNPSTISAPILFVDRFYGSKGYNEADCDIMLVPSSLDFQLTDNLAEIKQWSDIIKAVDVFITLPIYSYDQNGFCTRFEDDNNFDSKFIGSLRPKQISDVRGEDTIFKTKVNGVTVEGVWPDTTSLEHAFGDKYTEWSYNRLYELSYNGSVERFPTTIKLPEYSNAKIRENIEGMSNFYLLHSIKLDELEKSQKYGRQDIVVPDEYLQSLATRETMTDDYLSHDRLLAKYVHGYNSRLNLAGVKHELFRGFFASSMLAYCTHQNFESHKDAGGFRCLDFPEGQNIEMVCKVYIKDSGKVYEVKNKDTLKICRLYNEVNFSNKRSWGCYFYYPNRNAFKLVVTDNNGKNMVFDLKPHDFLNGAFAYLDYEQIKSASSEKLPEKNTTDNRIDVANKIYTSEVNNPFLFLATGINTVGSGNILGISSATQALSQGQFGQFPLYAFTDEGVWALEVSQTGTYSAKQPITRDVCINPESITQLDNEVLFATNRGIMLIAGSQTACITDSINSKAAFNPLSLPGMDRLHHMAGHTADTCFPMLPFRTYLEGCRMLYDYVHQHVIVFNKKYTYAYVYSLKSKEWGMMYSILTSAVKSYPDALAMTGQNRLVSFSDTSQDVSTGLFLSRPIKLETPDVMKTIDTCIQRGMFQRGDVNTVLWGSRDLQNWYLIGSSVDNFLRGIHGSPYKYFRIGGVTRFHAEQSLFGASLQFTPKFTNTPR